MHTRRFAALGLAGILILLAGCALFQQAPTALAECDCDSPACFSFAFRGFDQDGEVVEVEWDFGDGATAAGKYVSHRYEATGQYAVEVTATDDSGLRDTVTLTVRASREIPVQWGASIQAAIDAAAPGDTVMVEAGNYAERIDFKGKAITVRSADLSQPATISQRDIREYDSTGAVVTFAAGEGRDSVLEGLILRGLGYAAHYSGGGIMLHDSSPTIRNCTLGWFASVQGGGIAAYDSRALIEGCTLDGCTARLNGGGLYAQGETAFPELVGCIFQNNRAELGGGVYVCAAMNCTVPPGCAWPSIEGCRFVNNLASGNTVRSTTTVGGGVHVGAGLRLIESGNAWQGNSPMDLCFDEAM